MEEIKDSEIFSTLRLVVAPRKIKFSTKQENTF